MIYSYPYLENEEFLKEVDQLQLKVGYVKVTLLNWKEQEIEEIQGKIIDGSINVDASSSMRRSATLTLFVDKEDIDYSKNVSRLSLNKKIKLEIGLKNTTSKYKDYDILWYPQGIFVISDLSLSHSLQGVSVSLSLKDKMSLLNGECGGTFPASVSFHEIEEYDKDTQQINITKPIIYQIIMECVNHFGGEDISRILINDVPSRIKQVVKWTGDNPIYIWYNTGNSNEQSSLITLEDPHDSKYTTIVKGQDVGYVFTDFTYPGELIGEAGASVTSILDQIRDTLGNYEYFYDINGNFVFQEIKNYLNTSQSSSILTQLNRYDTSDTKYNANYNIEDSNAYINQLTDRDNGKSVYSFADNKLLISVSNSPQYGNIKNDFVVWGVRKTLTGEEYPFRYHLAIDKKPEVGNTYKVKLFDSEDGTPMAAMDSAGQSITTNDWRSELYLSGVAAEGLAYDRNYYFTELQNEWRRIFDLEKGCFTDAAKKGIDMNFFLDFIDTSSALGEYNVDNIGRRSMVVTDNSVNCMFEPEVPDLVFISTSKETFEGLTHDEQVSECLRKQQNYMQVSDAVYSALAIGGVYYGADVKIKELLYQYTHYNESINLTCLPIYHLEPNTRITVKDLDVNIADDYLITSISISLNPMNTMSINASKISTKI